MKSVPRHYERYNVAIFDHSDNYVRFVGGERVPISELDVGDWDPHIEPGCSLVTSWDDFQYDEHLDGRRYVDNLLSNMYVAECKDGSLRRTRKGNLRGYLTTNRQEAIRSLDIISISKLRKETCTRNRELWHYFDPIPEAYLTIYKDNNFSGILNLSWCGHLGCGRDFVHVIEDVLVFWMRGDGANVYFIDLYPFGLGRAGTREQFDRSIVVQPMGFYYDA